MSLMNSELSATSRYLKLWTLLTLGHWLLMLAAFHVPISKKVEEGVGLPPRSDKTIHLVLYAAFGAVLSGTLDAWCRRRNVAMPVIAQGAVLLALISAYGYLDEFTQPWTGRIYDLGDFKADVLGAAAGIVVFHFFRTVGVLRRIGLAA